MKSKGGLIRNIILGVIGLLVSVLVSGKMVNQARSWINILGIQFQPSEFVKPAFAVICGWLLAKGRLIQHTYGRLIAFILTGIVCFLLSEQTDSGYPPKKLITSQVGSASSLNIFFFASSSNNFP